MPEVIRFQLLHRHAWLERYLIVIIMLACIPYIAKTTQKTKSKNNA